MGLPNETEKLAIRVLLIEDDPIDAALAFRFADSFQRWRPHFTHVTDVSSALNEINQQSFDIFILDFWLETENSLKFLVELERRDIHAPKIIRSNITMNQVEALRLTATGAIFVAKGGCSARVLESAVEDAFALARISRETRSIAKVA